jgi:ribonuclease P protein component
LRKIKLTYPKSEKLKSRKAITILFTEGKSVSKYPLRLVFCPRTFDNNEMVKMGVSVSKKHFKKAVDRNYIKRILRESYRLNQTHLKETITVPYDFMLLYQSKEKISFAELNTKVVQLFEKFKVYISTTDSQQTVHDHAKP